MQANLLHVLLPRTPPAAGLVGVRCRSATGLCMESRVESADTALSDDLHEERLQVGRSAPAYVEDGDGISSQSALSRLFDLSSLRLPHLFAPQMLTSAPVCWFANRERGARM